MSRLAQPILAAALCLAGAGAADAAAARPQAPPASPAPAAEPTAAGDPTQDERRRREIEKLEAEIAGLRLQNEALDVRTRRWSAWLGAVGGITGALLTFVVGFLGWRLNSIQSRRTQQEKVLSREKLEQDRHLEREKQNLELYKGLGHESPRVQFAAASVLLERLTTYRDKKHRNEPLTPAEEIEHPTIIFVLIAVIKERSEDTPTHTALRKHIADNLVKALDAVMPAAGSPREAPSPLRPYDWQNANLAEAWWERVDARGVDFFRADFRRAGLGGAFLQGAVFYEADLSHAVLKRAHLEGANFYGANLSGARLDGASYDAKTVWPEGYEVGPDLLRAPAP